MALKLSSEDRDDAIAALKLYAADNFDEPMGNLAAGTLLDFFLKEIAPSVYNRAVSDVQERLQAHLMDLDVNVHEPEFPTTRRR